MTGRRNWKFSTVNKLWMKHEQKKFMLVDTQISIVVWWWCGKLWYFYLSSSWYTSCSKHTQFQINMIEFFRFTQLLPKNIQRTKREFRKARRWIASLTVRQQINPPAFLSSIFQSRIPTIFLLLYVNDRSQRVHGSHADRVAVITIGYSLSYPHPKQADICNNCSTIATVFDDCA